MVSGLSLERIRLFNALNNPRGTPATIFSPFLVARGFRCPRGGYAEP
jgi:hypothetical protein